MNQEYREWMLDPTNQDGLRRYLTSVGRSSHRISDITQIILIEQVIDESASMRVALERARADYGLILKSPVDEKAWEQAISRNYGKGIKPRAAMFLVFMGRMIGLSHERICSDLSIKGLIHRQSAGFIGLINRYTNPSRIFSYAAARHIDSFDNFDANNKIVVIPAIMDYLKNANAEYDITNSLIIILGRFGRDAEIAAPLLVDILNSSAYDWVIRSDASSSLMNMLPTKDYVNVAISAIDNCMCEETVKSLIHHLGLFVDESLEAEAFIASAISNKKYIMEIDDWLESSVGKTLPLRIAESLFNTKG